MPKLKYFSIVAVDGMLKLKIPNDYGRKMKIQPRCLFVPKWELVQWTVSIFEMAWDKNVLANCFIHRRLLLNLCLIATLITKTFLTDCKRYSSHQNPLWLIIFNLFLRMFDINFISQFKMELKPKPKPIPMCQIVPRPNNSIERRLRSRITN